MVLLRDEGALLSTENSRLERHGQSLVIAVARVKGVSRLPSQCRKMLKSLA